MCHHIGFHQLPTANPTHRQVVTGLFMIGIDQVTRDDCACNPLVNDLVIDPDDELVFFSSIARDSDRPIEFFRLFPTCDGQCPLL